LAHLDEPLSPEVKTALEKMDEDAQASSPTKAKSSGPLSPSTAGIEEKVRRVSLEDTAIPPVKSEIVQAPEKFLHVEHSDASEPEHSDVLEVEHLDTKTPPIPSLPALSPHPDDKPAPRFSKSTTDNKTPTPQSPEGATTSTAPVEDVEPLAEVDTSINTEQNTSTIIPAIETEADGSPVVGDYLKIMFVENKVVPTIWSVISFPS
jgi:SIT4-associating protein SAP185/190